MPDADPAVDFLLDLPPESQVLRDAQRASGMPVDELVTATGLSAEAIHVALRGFSYGDRTARVSVPTDETLVALSAALQVASDRLRALDRHHAAALLDAQGANHRIVSS